MRPTPARRAAVVLRHCIKFRGGHGAAVGPLLEQSGALPSLSLARALASASSSTRLSILFPPFPMIESLITDPSIFTGRLSLPGRVLPLFHFSQGLPNLLRLVTCARAPPGLRGAEIGRRSPKDYRSDRPRDQQRARQHT